MYNIKTLSIKNLLQQDKPGVSVDMKISSGIGFANTEFALGNQRKYASSLVSEFRIGIEIFSQI